MKKLKREKTQLPLLGIDVSDRAVKIIAASKKNGQKFITSCFKASYSNTEEMIDVLKQLKKEIAGYQSKAAISIPDSKVITQNILLDKRLDDGEVLLHIYHEASKYFNLPAGELFLDFKVLGERDAQRNKVFWAATKRKDVDDIVMPLKKSGIAVAVVEISSSSLQRAYKPVLTMQSVVQQTIAMAHFGAESMLLVVLKGGEKIYVVVENCSSDHKINILKRAIKLYFSSFPGNPLECIYVSGNSPDHKEVGRKLHALTMKANISLVFPELIALCEGKRYDPSEFMLSIGLAIRNYAGY